MTAPEAPAPTDPDPEVQDDPEAPAPEAPDPDADPLHALTFEFDPRSWSVWDVMEMRKALGYKTREDFENVIEENAELLQVGCAWLALRDTEYAGLSSKELSRRVRASQFVPPANPKQTRPS